MGLKKKFSRGKSSKRVLAINATTVEVTYKDAVKDVDASKYSIEGLTVTNAAVKQTDSKTVVLTTSTQEGAKEYTVKSGAIKVGTFKGISAVTPASITVTTNSQQGVVGKNVTVKAQVTVAAGQSKAGIPVTFNINAGDKKFNKDHVVEVFTNADGVAEYSYTQYSAGVDKVIAYATGNANVRAVNGVVYWGVSELITLTEVTEGNSLANGSKKVYKVKTATPSYDADGKAYVNVAFKENINVTPDKAVTEVTVTDASGDLYPYQFTTGGSRFVKVYLNGGEGTFTLQGKNSSVTPIVFVDGSDGSVKNNEYASTELQAQAPTVKFEGVQSFGLTIESKGVKESAATGALESSNAANQGGRDYKVTVTDKDGKLASEGTKVYVAFKEGNLKKGYNTGVQLVQTKADGTRVIKPVKVYTSSADAIQLTVNAKGEVEFTLEGLDTQFATPTIYLETGDKVGLDSTDLQKDGDIVYFNDADVTNASLQVINGGKAVTSLIGDGIARAAFTYQSLDQNGKPYKTGTKFNTTFELTAGFNDLYYWENGVRKTLEAGKTVSVIIEASSSTGTAVLEVAGNNSTSATVKASASNTTLPNKTASVSFTKYASSEVVTGPVRNVNPATKELEVTENGKVYPYSYATGTYQILGQPVTLTGFEAKLDGSYVTVTRAANGTLTFNIITTGNAVPSAPTAPELGTATVGGNKPVTINAVPSGTTAYLAPAGTKDFTVGSTITTAAAGSTTIASPSAEGVYHLFLKDSFGRTAVSTGTITVDTTKPKATVTSGTTNNLVLTYSEPLYNNTTVLPTGDVTSLFTANNVSATGSIAINIISAAYDANTKSVTFVLDGTETRDTITVSSNVKDLAGNVVDSDTDVATFGQSTWILN